MTTAGKTRSRRKTRPEVNEKMSWNINDPLPGTLGLPNFAYGATIPIYALSPAFVEMVRMWDFKWEPALSKVMPYTRSPNNGSATFGWPLTIDPQVISNMYSPYSRNEDYLSTGLDMERWWTRLTKIGFIMEPEEFLVEFSPQCNFGTDVRMQRLTQLCVRAIERRIELELVNYLWGNELAIQNFSNQQIGRQIFFDLTSADNGMMGHAWNDYTNSDPFRDMDNAIEHQESLGDLPLNNLFIGSKTAKVLKNHDVIIERLKYVRDLSGGTLQAFYAGLDNGMKITKVVAHTYKEEAANVGAIESPGRGDTAAAEWGNDNKYWFMRANGYEFAFLAADGLGFTFTSRCNQYHDGNGLYTYSWVDHDPHIVRTRFEKKFAPGVGDFANMVRLDHVCPTTA